MKPDTDPTPYHIAIACCRVYDITVPAFFRRHAQTREITEARRAFVQILRSHGLSSWDIAEAGGWKSHASVLELIANHEADIEASKKYTARFARRVQRVIEVAASIAEKEKAKP